MKTEEIIEISWGHRHNQPCKSLIEVDECVEGEFIEDKIYRILTSNEPIEDKAPLIYQERKEGVNPLYNIRSDRFDMALDMTDKIAAEQLSKRQEKLKIVKDDVADTGTEGKA